MGLLEIAVMCKGTTRHDLRIYATQILPEKRLSKQRQTQGGSSSQNAKILIK